jgi:hypothetical protein
LAQLSVGGIGESGCVGGGYCPDRPGSYGRWNTERASDLLGTQALGPQRSHLLVQIVVGHAGKRAKWRLESEVDTHDPSADSPAVPLW